MSLGVLTEPFPNGERFFIVLRFDERRPTEVEFETHLVHGSKPDAVVITATYGNLTRLRDAYLRAGVENAKEIYGGFRGTGFAPPSFFPRGDFLKDEKGDLLFVTAPDEDRPWETKPYPHPGKLLQYYRKRNATEDLSGFVNARLYFWKTRKKVPGGVAYENTGLLEPFDTGERFSFGIYNGRVSDLLKRGASKPLPD
ncbi:MAG: hypothetical protein M5R36_27845 [Deltaproteobacteria bacterium]|nr:hypothetical protein [Deltaproteobacteria bacterium]